MSWNCQRRLITDAKRPLGLRYMALLHAVEHYTYTTNTGFESVCEQLGQLHGFTHGGKNSTSVIEAAFANCTTVRDWDLLSVMARAELLYGLCVCGWKFQSRHSERRIRKGYCYPEISVKEKLMQAFHCGVPVVRIMKPGVRPFARALAIATSSE